MSGAAGADPGAAVARERGGRRFVVAAIAAVLGAGVAAAYAYFVGCRTGTCPLTSNVWTASAYGALVGLVVGWPGHGGPGRGSPGPRRPEPGGADRGAERG